eukprot:6185101-Pleurochrysis_carterae.AAC.1
MHRNGSISREQGFNDATECPTPIHYARVAQKYSLRLYKLVRLLDLWSIKILTMPLVGGADLHGTAFGDPIN